MKWESTTASERSAQTKWEGREWLIAEQKTCAGGRYAGQLCVRIFPEGAEEESRWIPVSKVQ